jgi:hypothetical protein
MVDMSIEEAIQLMKATADELPGAFGAEFALYYKGRTTGPEPWACDVEGDLLSVDNDGGIFRVLGATPQEAIQRGVDEAWRRVPPKAP